MLSIDRALALVIYFSHNICATITVIFPDTWVRQLHYYIIIIQIYLLLGHALISSILVERHR